MRSYGSVYRGLKKHLIDEESAKELKKITKAMNQSFAVLPKALP